MGIQEKRDRSAALGYAGLGFEFVGIFLFFTVGGYFLDRYLFGRPQAWLFVGLFLGLTGSFYHLYRRVLFMQTETDEKNQTRAEPESADAQMDRIERGLREVGDRIDEEVRRSNARRKPGGS